MVPQAWTCPKCGSDRIKPPQSRRERLAGFVLLAMLCAGVGILFPPLWLAIPFLLGAAVVAPLLPLGRWYCHRCRHSWR